MERELQGANGIQVPVAFLGAYLIALYISLILQVLRVGEPSKTVSLSHNFKHIMIMISPFFRAPRVCEEAQ